jgi:ABC-type lipoprotein export system ATPase subunit
MDLIELTDVRKVYTLGEVQVEALRGISLRIVSGEFVALVGASGSGKSTLMNTLGCLDRPTGGSYKLAGQEIVNLSRDERARVRNQRIGFVFQNFNLLARTSALENVELPLLYSRSVSARQRRKRAIEMLERVGLGNRMDHHPGQLSGGQQQRVAIARALVQEPEVILADEPVASLDPRNTHVVMGALAGINERYGITVLCNLHSLDLARGYCSRVVGLADGRMVFDGSPAALTDAAARELYGLEAAEAVGPAPMPVGGITPIPAHPAMTAIGFA